MKTIAEAVPCEDQPINAATLMGENRYLTSWITPDSLQVQEKYAELVQGVSDQEQKILALWTYVKNIPYTHFVKTKISVDGKSFQQADTWLEPAQAMQAGKLNCFNKSVLLASLLRQEFPTDSVWVCLNNVNVDGIDGHAVTYLKLDRDYILETTNPGLQSPFILADNADIYEAVIWFNDQGVAYIPGLSLREPLGICCIRWLEDYLNERLCTDYIL